VGAVDQEETGRDRSFLAIEAAEDIGFSAIEKALAQARLSLSFHQLWHEPDRPAAWTFLVEVFGFVDAGGPGVARLMDGLGNRVKRVLRLGGYATPLGEADLTDDAVDDTGREAAS